ncbi:PLP-dependent aminotransferase family protein [Nocardioides sp. YIM 152315]|uniref:aminotransferase-like domain-containing protein n=1 Tax=Nocardioides sp. YIM 152315 TaxID=3031760 RepID=UPI0023DAA4DF|nr:PLP-dependent aminotransferase family protein [Nocardioides sp. YIM 152315]MDF1603270.1 PLP-dependent aminotransferase family protein [Nocardioides sp. YIM 152315]
MNDDSSSRIVASLHAWIAEAPPGARLPSTRALVAEHGVSPVTVQKALRALATRGAVETRPGVGTFVREMSALRPHDHGWQTAALGAQPRRGLRRSVALRTAPSDAVALHSGYPDRELLPHRLVRSAYARAARRDAAVTRPPSAGLPELQAWFAAEVGAAANDVVVVPGSQSGLATAFRSLVGAGRPLVVESPTYWGAILAAAQVGVEVVPVPSGRHGPDPDELARAFARTGARAFYAQPSFANPTGARWSPDVAERVLDLVRDHGAFLIEDDWAHDFGIDAEPVPLAARDGSGHVVHLRSLTKSVSPSVRVAGVVVRGPARERILADVEAESMYVSGLLQAVALDVVTQPSWRTHLRALRRQLGARRDLLAAAVREHVPQATFELPAGGLNLWLRLPDGTDVRRLAGDCEAEGVVIAPGDEWFPAEPAGCFVRLNFSGPDPGSFERGTQVIGESLR